GAIGRYRAAIAIAIVSLDMLPPQMKQMVQGDQVTMKSQAPPLRDTLPTYLYLSAAAARRLLGVAIDSARVGTVGKTVQGSVTFGEQPAPARNVVAILPGSDPKLRGEYVAIGAHNDHIGFDHTPADHD